MTMERIRELIKKNFGNGSATAQVYATSWVARISNKDKNLPEFPESLDYIRRTQFDDGSWGSKKPLFILKTELSAQSVP